jgi:hypothetical protein
LANASERHLVFTNSFMTARLALMKLCERTWRSIFRGSDRDRATRIV